MTSNTCPQCGKGQLYFSGDGRARECERCGHRVQIATLRTASLQQLIEDTTLLPILSESSYRQAQSTSFRISLAQGIGAVKEGDIDEAYHCLTRVLRGDWDEDDRANAWLWLSQVVTADAEKRHCLEQVLAFKPAHGLARRGLAVLDGRLQPDDIIDPDQLEREASDEPIAAEAEQFTCPRCAGHMNYTPDGEPEAASGRALLCEFCHYRQELGEDALTPQLTQFGEGEFEQEFTTALATAKGHLQPIQMRTFLCHNCAVDFVLSPATLSVTCPYCNAVYVIETAKGVAATQPLRAESREIIPPHALIPFHLNEDGAKEALRRWFKQHGIERPRLSPIVGIYLPAWTFDMGGEVKWSGLENKEREGWVSVQGNHLPFYDDVLVPANQKIPETLAKGLEAFDLKALVTYDASYLAAWPAERYQIPLADASLLARKKVLKDIRHHTDRLTRGKNILNLHINHAGLVIESFKHILLPVWLVHYKVEGKLYDVVVNGQNGKVHGKRPQGTVGKFLSRLLGQS